MGIAQDAGYPQAGCRAPCCAPAWGDPARRRHAACAAIVDPAAGSRWLIDATPDFRAQLRLLDETATIAEEGVVATAMPPAPALAGILLTHGHIGHYTGLLHLGREAMGARGVPVYAMPRLAGFLARHQPWAELVAHDHIVLRPMAAGEPIPLGNRVSATPVLVPHRDEHSETVAFRIEGPRRSMLYLPDIDGWEAWDGWGVRIEDVVRSVDVAYVDGTFFDAGEVPGRRISDVPHPLISSTLARLARSAPGLASRVRFIHLNHTNPLLRDDAEAQGAADAVAASGCRVAAEGERQGL